jgi:hypothetical protein
MSALYSASAVVTAPDVDGKFTMDRPAGDFRRVLRGGVRFLEVSSAAMGTRFGKVRSYYLSSLRLCYLKGNSACLGSRLGSWRPLRTAVTAV